MKNIHVGLALIFFVVSFGSCAINQQYKIQPAVNDQSKNAHFEKGKESDSIATWYLMTAVKQGAVYDPAFLGFMYYRGEGVPRDYAKAAEWYRKAAEQGIAAAQLNLGRMYEKGEGVPPDCKEAVKWYRKSAEQGNTDARFLLDKLLEKIDNPES